MSIGQLSRGAVPRQARVVARRDWVFLVSLVLLGIAVILGLAGRWLVPYDPTALYVGPVNGAVSLAHPLGTDDLGRDILSRLLDGARVSLFAPAAIVLFSTVLGAGLAIAAAWFGGWLQAVVARLVDVIFAIPGLVLAVLAVAMFGIGLVAPVAALSIAYIPVVARVTQTAASRELGKPYFAALKVQGVSAPAMWFKHLVPALVPMLSAQLAVGFGYAMLDLAAISFLGLGQQPPASDWGSMISAGKSSILAGAPEQALFASLAVIVTVLAVSIVGARVTTLAEEKER